jgi:hypothetical protein
MNCRGNMNNKFPADAGFVSNKDPKTAAVLRAK